MEIKELVDFYLTIGINSKASDLYLLPNLLGYQVSYRYGNQKVAYSQLTIEQGDRFLVYCKYLGDMDISEKRRVQIGSVEMSINEKKIRLRLSSVGDFRQRESLVIRFLVNRQESSDFVTLLPNQFHQMSHQMKKVGLYLFAGATGAGKTTTMYHLVRNELAMSKQVITVEDPVEIDEPNFLQLQVNQDIDQNYGELLKACLRHRPDILIIGEIRDEVTASLAIRAALTGHLVLSTIYGVSKDLVWERLLELGVSEWHVKQTLRGIVFQKLFTLKCSFCLNGSCQPHCSRYQNGVLFDGNYYEQGQKVKTDNWSKNLRKSWALGYLSTDGYREEMALGEGT